MIQFDEHIFQVGWNHQQYLRILLPETQQSRIWQEAEVSGNPPKKGNSSSSSKATLVFQVRGVFVSFREG